MSDLLDYFKGRTQSIIELVTQSVNHETFSTDKAAVDKFAKFMQAKCRELGADSVELVPQKTVGDCIVAKWNANASGKPILFVGHLDTVWKPGTLATRPVTITEDGVLFGPGALDMKSGNAIALTTIHGLLERGELPERPIWVCFNSDEEIGSVASTPLIESLAAQACLVLVMEPARPNGSITTERKGIAAYEMHITGLSAHAGNAPERGINAVVEAAQQTLILNSMNDFPNGTSVSVTMVSGGTAGNVIPDQASIHIDTRTRTAAAAVKIDEAIMNLQPQTPGAQIRIARHHSRLPMERDELMKATFRQAKSIATAHGFPLEESGAGGVSDANTCAALGIPTLDGLGPLGDGMHALHEQLRISSLAERAALCAALVREWKE